MKNGGIMMLWREWFKVVIQLKTSCSRNRTFIWLVIVLVGMSVRSDLYGVTSFVRAGFVESKHYKSLLNMFHSKALQLDILLTLWVKMSLTLFNPVTVDGYIVLIADGIKVAKEGKKMPAVKSMFQESASNSKASYIMGHSFQSIALLIEGFKEKHFAVPLLSNICEGIKFSNFNKKTLLDKLADMFLKITEITNIPMMLVADAYYTSKKIILPLIQEGHHLLSRAAMNSVAYMPVAEKEKRGKGRPKIYGTKLKLKKLFNSSEFKTVKSPVYGEKDIYIQVLSMDLMWRPVGRLVQFILVKHPERGNIILMTTLFSMSPEKAIYLYSLRFKIEVSFKEAIYTVGTYGYRFWMKNMDPVKKTSGTQFLHRKSKIYVKAVRRKMDAYHRWVQLACIAQGLLQYLAVNFHKDVWGNFRSWMRTMNTNSIPSEQVVAQALRASLPEFLLTERSKHNLQKIILEKADPDRLPVFIHVA